MDSHFVSHKEFVSMPEAMESSVRLRNPLIVALDVDSREACFRIARQIGEHIGAFKVGPRLIVRYGADLISELARLAPVFVDNKYLDIPNTMESAVRASFESGATLVTVHAWSGKEALARMAQVERELNSIRPFQILVVTVLTSFSQETLPPPMHAHPLQEQVNQLADLAVTSSLTGLVCSPEEVGSLRRRYPKSFLVTPGIRLPHQRLGDQKRVLGPRQALDLGASALVVGRPIVEAPNPLLATKLVLTDIGGEA